MHSFKASTFALSLCVLFVPSIVPATLAQTFQAPVPYATGRLAPNGVAVGDFNGDGKLDVVVTNEDLKGTIAVFLGNGDGTLQPPVLYAAGAWPGFVLVADFNKDGHVDLAVANRAIGNRGWVRIFRGNGD